MGLISSYLLHTVVLSFTGSEWCVCHYGIHSGVNLQLSPPCCSLIASK